MIIHPFSRACKASCNKLTIESSLIYLGRWPGGRHMYTVDIDVGGTLTDGLFSDGQPAIPVKVDTTPHDLTVCFRDCLTEGARRFGFDDLTAFLNQVDL